MVVYYYVLLFIPICMLVGLVRQREPQLALLVAIAAATILLSGLRRMSDVDFPEYVGMYAENPPLSGFDSEANSALYGEPGYLLLSAAFKSLGADFVWLSLFCALLSIGIKALVANYFTRAAGIVVTLYLCIQFVTVEFIQMRWAISTAFVIAALCLLYRRRSLASTVCFATAIGLHYFAAAFLVIWAIARIRKERHFNAAVVSMTVFGLALTLGGSTILGLLVTDNIRSVDLYVVQRFLSYAVDPLSALGPLSFARLAMYPTAYWILCNYDPEISSDGKVVFLRRIAFSSIALTMLVSFLPMMHFRAVVIADFFSLLLVFRAIELSRRFSVRASIVGVFCCLFALWYFVDVGNYISSGRLSEYRTWLAL